MHPITLRLTAAGYTPWVPINRLQTSFNVGLEAVLSSGASMTYTVEYSLDNPNGPMNLTQNFTLSRTTTVLTVTKIAHGLSVGDWAKLWANGGAPLDAEFAAVASVVDANNFTVTVADAGLSAGNGVGWLQTMRATSLAAMAAKTATVASSLTFPVIATRLHVSTYGSGTVDFNVIQGRG